MQVEIMAYLWRTNKYSSHLMARYSKLSFNDRYPDQNNDEITLCF